MIQIISWYYPQGLFQKYMDENKVGHIQKLGQRCQKGICECQWISGGMI